MHIQTMIDEISTKTLQLLKLIPEESVRKDIMEIFSSKPALYAPVSEEVLERVRFAVIKLAFQGPKMLKLAKKFYVEDTRDLLVSADFGNELYSYKTWAESMLKDKNA